MNSISRNDVSLVHHGPCSTQISYTFAFLINPAQPIIKTNNRCDKYNYESTLQIIVLSATRSYIKRRGDDGISADGSVLSELLAVLTCSTLIAPSLLSSP